MRELELMKQKSSCNEDDEPGKVESSHSQVARAGGQTSF